jgi:hypothetical protein
MFYKVFGGNELYLIFMQKLIICRSHLKGWFSFQVKLLFSILTNCVKKSLFFEQPPAEQLGCFSSMLFGGDNMDLGWEKV